MVNQSSPGNSGGVFDRLLKMQSSSNPTVGSVAPSNVTSQSTPSVVAISQERVNRPPDEENSLSSDLDSRNAGKSLSSPQHQVGKNDVLLDEKDVSSGETRQITKKIFHNASSLKLPKRKKIASYLWDDENGRLHHSYMTLNSESRVVEISEIVAMGSDWVFETLKKLKIRKGANIQEIREEVNRQFPGSLPSDWIGGGGS